MTPLPPSTVGRALTRIRELEAEVTALRERNERLAAELHAAERRARDEGERAERAERASRDGLRDAMSVADDVALTYETRLTWWRGQVAALREAAEAMRHDEGCTVAAVDAALAALPPREEEDPNA